MELSMYSLLVTSAASTSHMLGSEMENASENEFFKKKATIQEHDAFSIANNLEVGFIFIAERRVTEIKVDQRNQFIHCKQTTGSYLSEVIYCSLQIIHQVWS